MKTMMRKSWLIIFCLFCLAGSRSLYAQTGTLRFHAAGGLWLPMENVLNAGTQTGFGLSLAVIRHLDLVFDFKIGRLDILDEKHSLDGEMTLSPFILSGRFHLFPERKWDVYGLLGGGVIFSSIQNRDVSDLQVINIKQSSKTRAGVLAGVGGSISIAKRFVVFMETSFLQQRALITTTIEEMNRDRREEEWSFNMSLTSISMGLRYSY